MIRLLFFHIKPFVIFIIISVVRFISIISVNTSDP